MTAPDAEKRALGPCAGCGYPVYAGDARPDTDHLLHPTLCVPLTQRPAVGHREIPPRAPGRPA